MTFRDLMLKTPPATHAWTCRWYLTCVYLCVWLLGLGLTVIPGVAGVVAVTVAVTTFVILTLMRTTNDSCDV